MHSKIKKHLLSNSKFIILFMLLFTSFIEAQQDVFEICRTGSLEDIKAVYKSNPESIDQNNENGFSALTLACYSSNEEVVIFLVDKVKSINGTSKYGSPLMAATVKGNTNIVKLLLKYKADVTIADANKTTALHYATLFKNKKIVQLLVNAGANANIKDANGKSALDHAVILKEEEIIKILKNN